MLRYKAAGLSRSRVDWNDKYKYKPCEGDIIDIFTSTLESEVAQSCPTLCNPMGCSLPCSSVHGIFQAKVLDWIVISFSRGSQSRDWTWVSCIVGRRFTIWATREIQGDNQKKKQGIGGNVHPLSNNYFGNFWTRSYSHDIELLLYIFLFVIYSFSSFKWISNVSCIPHIFLESLLGTIWVNITCWAQTWEQISQV